MVESYTPSHKDFSIHFRSGEYRSSLKSLKVKFELKQLGLFLDVFTNITWCAGVQSRRGYDIFEGTNKGTQRLHHRPEWPWPWGQHQPKQRSCVQCVNRKSSIECDWRTNILHIAIDLANHSCEPNATFDMSSPDRSKWQLRALKDIYPGDESMPGFIPD